MNENCSFYWALTTQRLTVMVGRGLLIVILPKLWECMGENSFRDLRFYNRSVGKLE